MLHGFAATARHWDGVVALTDCERYSPTAIELSATAPLTLVGVLDRIAATPAERFVLCGYSMGGRVALHAARAMPERIERLVLVSSSAGIEDAELRAARRAADDQLAATIEAGSIDAFIAHWRDVALFAGDPPAVRALAAADAKRLRPEQVAAMLRTFGAGVLPPLWSELGRLTMPVTLLAGERDGEYQRHAKRMASLLAAAHYELIAGVGHRVALEAPAAIVRAFD